MASIPVPEPHTADHQPDPAPAASTAQSVHIRRLVVRIAGKDRIAFADLYDAVSPTLYRDIRSVLASPVRATGVLAATFVEVWALARFHAGAGDDVEAWITDIAVRRTMDRQFAGDSDRPAQAAADHPASPRSWLRRTVLADWHDRQYLLSLAALLNRPHVAFPDRPEPGPGGDNDAAGACDLAVEEPPRSGPTTGAEEGCPAAGDQRGLVYLATTTPPAQCSSRQVPPTPETP